METYNPLSYKKDLGKAEAGTHAYGLTNKDGITEKKLADDIAVNEPLTPPPGAINSVLVGGVKIVVDLGVDYKPVVLSDGRLRTCEITIGTHVTELTPGTYGKGAKSPNSGTPGPKA